MKKVIVALLLLSLIFVIGASGCGQTGPQTVIPPQTTNSSTSGAASYNILIENFAFNPSEITVDVGTTVIWENMDSAPHKIVSNSGVFQGPQINKGENYSFTFETAGTYDYYCSIHPSMKGSVIVK